ncbi:MAG: hypothetical protein ACXVA9_06830 [Bdellovibrionales bacterium]
MIYKSILYTMTAAIAIAISLSGCATPLHNQKLFWKSTNDGKDFNIGKLSKYKIKIGTFKDERKTNPKNKIAENTEGEKVREVLVDTDNFGPFVTENIKKVMERSGLEIVESGEDLNISGVIKDLFVTEASLYKGSATIKYIVRKGDTEVWSGVETGGSKRFGRSYKMENYMEAVSDSVVDSLMGLLNDQAFRSALK